MAEKSIKITIATALNAAGFTAARRAISNLVSGTKDFASKVGGNLMNIKAGFDMVAGAASKLMAAMSKGMEFERMTVTFKSLTGSMELAKAHMKDLQDLGRTPPFSLEQFAAASQAMMKMTGGMAGFRNEMAIVGDMAAATGNDIATVGRAFGLAYQVIRDGQDFGRAGQQLYSLGIMTKKQVAEFAEMSKAGTDNMAVWNKLMDVFGRYKGAMEATQKTAKGLTEAIQGEAQVAITDFSTAITETAKPALEGLLGYMKRINEDGTIEDWADLIVEKLGEVGRVAKTDGDVFGWFWKSMKTVGASVTSFREGMKIADEMGLKGDERGAFARKFRSDVIDEIWGNNEESNKDRADYKEYRKEEKAKRRAVERAKTEAEAEKRIREDMAKAQAETTAKFEKARQDAIDETMAKLKELKDEGYGYVSTIQESVKRDFSDVEKAISSLSSARTEEEIKSAKSSVDAAIKKQKADEDAFDRLQAKIREADRNASEFVASYEKEQEEASKRAAKEDADEKIKAIRKLHDERMKQLDKEDEKVKKQIDDAKAKGFDNVMATAGGGFWGNGTLDQAGDIRAERQKKIGEDRAAKAEDALKAKMARFGATLDDPSKLGRMSNLERAAFERLKLKDAEAKAAKIQKEKDEREKQIVRDLDAINNRLKEVGL